MFCPLIVYLFVILSSEVTTERTWLEGVEEKWEKSKYGRAGKLRIYMVVKGGERRNVFVCERKVYGANV